MKHELNTCTDGYRANQASGNTSPGSGAIVHTSTVAPDRRIALPALVVGILTVYAMVNFAFGWYWIVLIILATVAAINAVHWRAFIEPANGVVREEARLFGRRLIAKRCLPLRDFVAIVFQLRGSDDQEWWVGIRHRSGRKIWIKSCGANDTALRPPGRFAEEYAWRLSCDTGLEIEEFRPQHPMRWVKSLFRRGSPC